MNVQQKADVGVPSSTQPARYAIALVTFSRIVLGLLKINPLNLLWNKFSSSQLGYFLKFDLWLEAIKLLDFQIGQMGNNKHYNTLSMFYYKQTAQFFTSIKTEEYFEEKFASNLFYGL